MIESYRIRPDPVNGVLMIGLTYSEYGDDYFEPLYWVRDKATMRKMLCELWDDFEKHYSDIPIPPGILRDFGG